MQDINIVYGVCVLIIGLALVLSQAILAYREKFLYSKQMLDAGYEQGIPFSMDGSIWGIIPILPFMAILTAFYGHTWQHVDLFILGSTLAIAVCGSYSVHSWFLDTLTPSVHVQEKKFTPAGYLNLVFTAGVLWVLILFYLYTPEVPFVMVVTVSAVVLTYIILSNNMLIWVMELPYYPDKPFKNLKRWLVIAVSVAFLTWQCLIALPH